VGSVNGVLGEKLKAAANPIREKWVHFMISRRRHKSICYRYDSLVWLPVQTLSGGESPLAV
jgi:hypothetical protein